LAIEAALRATGQPPGGQRQFAFKQWPDFQPGTWASVTTAQAEPTSSVPAIVATDRDAGAIDAAQANAERAGVAELIDFRVAPIADLQTPEGGPGHLVTNPPWGGRVSAERDLRNLYATLGNVGKKELSGWGLGVLLADRDLARQIRPGLNESLTLELGGQHAWFMTGKFPN
jgi:putative N6-adenine-specific DNA methylase